MESERFKHSFKVVERPLASLSVYNTGQQRCEAGHAWGPGVRDHYLIHYITEGRGVYTVGGASYALSRGDMFLIRPDETIFYAADRQDPWSYCWVGFGGLDAGGLMARTGFLPDKPLLHFSSGEKPRQLLLDIYGARGGREHEVLEMTGRLYAFLAWLVASAGSPPRRKFQAGQEHVRRACAFIANNFAASITVEDVAAHVGVCRSRLYRTFETHMHTSPAQYLTRFRMRQACLLLERGDLPVKAVAYSVGFEDPLYFSRRFREVIGCAPSAYAGGRAGTAGSEAGRAGDGR